MIRTCPSCGKKNRVPAARLLEGPRCGACKAEIGPPDAPVTLTAADFDEVIGGSPVPVVVDFWAAWCGPCRAVAPVLESLARKHAGRVLVAKVNTDEEPALAGRYAIQGIPAFIRFEGGSPARRATGAMPEAQMAQRLFS